ncbi:MAG: Ku protein, partial [Parafilimonas sp.]
GLGTFVLRNKESLCVIKPSDKILVLQKIRFAEEVRKPDDLNIPETFAKPAEIKMAVSLIEQLTEKFDISKYSDTYSEKLMKLIEAKAKGKKIQAPQMRVVHSKTQDLMAQLKASLPAGKKVRKAS